MALYVKGQTGNPRGRPRKDYAPGGLTEVLQKVIRQKGPDGKTNAEKIAKDLIKMATNELVDDRTRLDAMKYVFDRLEGRPAQRTEICSPADHPLELATKVLHDDDALIRAAAAALAEAGEPVRLALPGVGTGDGTS